MELDEKELVALLENMQAGDEYAFQMFYETWYNKVFHIALAITRHEADAKDVAQESMIEIHNSISQLRDLGYFKLWVNRIVLSKCNRIFRKRKAVTIDETQMNALLDQREVRDYMLPEYNTHKHSDYVVLMDLMKNLPEKASEILNLMYFEQLSMKEMATLLNIPENTVKSRLYNAKGSLRKEIINYEQKENCKLDFKASSLEATLVSACLVKAPFFFRGSKLRNPLSSIVKMSAISTKALVLSAMSAVIIGGGTIAYTNYKHNAEIPTYNISNTSDFPAMKFQNIEINNSKDAYFILMKYAHCEYELNKLNESDKANIQKIKAEFDKNETDYKMLLQQNTKK